MRARAFDRAESRDSARILYVRAARAIPQIADWLYLRAAGVTPSADEREDLYDRVRDELAKERIPWTEAFALERFADIPAAIEKYRAVGAQISVFRLRAAIAGAPPARDSVRADMLRWLATGLNAETSRDGVALFDQLFTKRTPPEELVLARAAWRGGVSKRTAAGYAAATKARLGSSADFFAYGSALARLNRDREAAAAFARVTVPASLAAAAQYQRARAFLALGNASGARAILRDLTVKAPADTSAASALLLLSDLATDEGRDKDAQATLETIEKRFPKSRHAGTALFRAGLVAYIAGSNQRAAALFDSVWRRHPGHSEADAARYWAGRALARGGDVAGAQSRWRAAMQSDPSSYHAVVSAKRLRVPVLDVTDTTSAYPLVPSVDSAAARANVLRAVGMDVEAKMELDRLYRDAVDSPDRLIATAKAFAGTDQASRSILLGLRAIRAGQRTPATYRLVFPVLERETISASAKKHGLDPVLIASLIRQESNYNPRAVSPVGALGLMQLMPSVGRTLAAAEGIRPWSDERLFEPAINIRLGTRHLSGLFREHANIARVLAAYNAGASRVTRWSRKAGANDPELFAERIPFVETRDYVRTIQRNREFYRALYAW